MEHTKAAIHRHFNPVYLIGWALLIVFGCIFEMVTDEEPGSISNRPKVETTSPP